MPVDKDPIPFPRKSSSEDKPFTLGFVTRWLLGGIILLTLVIGAGTLALTVAFMARGAGYPKLGLLWGFTVFAAGMAGVSWAKSQWIIHVMPELLADFEKKIVKND